MAFLFGRNKQKVIVDLTKSAKDLLVKIQTVDQLPTQVCLRGLVVLILDEVYGADFALHRRRSRWRKS